MTTPKYSVIIPTFNIGERLARTLESLVSQEMKDFEVIISDDGSTDHTTVFAQTYADRLDLHILRSDNWGGPARPRNFAISQARGQWIAFLDHDDWWHPRKLVEVDKYTHDFDVIYHDMDLMDSSTDKVLRKSPTRALTSNAFVNLLIRGNCIPNSGCTVRKKLIDEIGGIDENRKLIAVEDFDLWICLAKHGARFHHIECNLGGIESAHLTRLTESSDKQDQRYVALYDKHLPDLDDTNASHAKAFLSYLRARIYHKLGRLSDARFYYLQAFKVVAFPYKIRAWLGLVLSYRFF